MRILSFVDVHAHKASLQKIIAKAKHADALICAGDLSTFGVGLKSSLQTLQKAGKPLLIVPGNHETSHEIISAARGLKTVIPLHGSAVRIGEIVFLGYGGGGFSLIEKGLEKYVEKVRLRLPPGKKTVFVTHAPPYGTTLDYLDWLKEHRGCKSTAQMIRILQPSLVVCGHFHEMARMRCMVGKTQVINPGDTGMMTEL